MGFWLNIINLTPISRIINPITQLTGVITPFLGHLYIPKNPNPSRKFAGLMVETSHRWSVIGLVRGNPGFLGQTNGSFRGSCSTKWLISTYDCIWGQSLNGCVCSLCFTISFMYNLLDAKNVQYNPFVRSPAGIHTLPEANIGPENRPSRKETASSNHWCSLAMLVSERVPLPK